MAISVNPVFPVTADQAATSTVVLQPGTVINARVLQVLDDNLVRIAIAGISVDVLSQVELQPGTALKLAVSQTSDGIRLAVVPSGDIFSPGAQAADASNMVALAAASPAEEDLKSTLSPEALVVTSATQTAAAK